MRFLIILVNVDSFVLARLILQILFLFELLDPDFDFVSNLLLSFQSPLKFRKFFVCHLVGNRWLDGFPLLLR